MSRSRKGAKGPGHEYWSGRHYLTEPGRFTKTETHRAERREGKRTCLTAEADEPANAADRDECEGCPVCVCRKCGGPIAAYVNMPDVYACMCCGYQPPEANDVDG